MEVFEPELPTTCRTFLNRCNPGAINSFKGTKVHRVVENYALHAGFSKGWGPIPMTTGLTYLSHDIDHPCPTYPLTSWQQFRRHIREKE